jgi:hypothetical protein
MEIFEVKTGLRKPVVIQLVEEKDFKILTKRRYSFHWKVLKDVADIYKLQIEKEKDILGVMGLIDVPEENRIEIRLLASSRENQGRKKVYDRVAGCMIAFACYLAAKKYDDGAGVSLLPKTNLIRHYMQKYQMADGGRQLLLEKEALDNILKEYFYV